MAEPVCRALSTHGKPSSVDFISIRDRNRRQLGRHRTFNVRSVRRSFAAWSLHLSAFKRSSPSQGIESEPRGRRFKPRQPGQERPEFRGIPAFFAVHETRAERPGPAKGVRLPRDEAFARPRGSRRCCE
jgi:hypothetical protein